MNQLTVIEYQDKRVLTTQQLAQVYETEPDRIHQNYTRNNERFVDGRDYYFLEGAELKAFKGSLSFSEEPSIKFAPSLILWTERGANRHCKILDTDKAWQQFDVLEDTYFKVKDNLPAIQELSPQLQLLINMEMKQKELETRTALVERRLDTVKETIVQRDDNWRTSINNLMAKATQGTTDRNYQAVRSDSYMLLEQRAGCDLSARLRNLQSRMLDRGATKSKVDALTKMDVVESDKRLREIYTMIVKEMVIRFTA